ncbi:hypothetical protein [Salinivirga cyanobacteriivorans]|uniref:hypothetical protein n=1 Tax=Salinivirga cyanobacteriivorans TaxID=1307839 RepID=UPI000716D63B|nr:hypothetical protein [Salinivirga cyanobacteriivorans]
MSIPVGDFGDDDEGGDGIGASGGLKLNYLFNENGVGAFGAVDFFIKGLHKTYRRIWKICSMKLWCTGKL